VSIKNDDLGALKFTYVIEVRKGDGSTDDVTEKDTTLYPGAPLTTRVSGASIIRISASDVKRAP
jgi:hypothetical protein